MTRIAMAVLIGLLWAGTIPATWPWTATIFGLALFNIAMTAVGEDTARRTQKREASAVKLLEKFFGGNGKTNQE